MPHHLLPSRAFDPGADLARLAAPKVLADLPVNFCDPHSPWQRGTNEDTKGCCDNIPRGAQISASTALTTSWQWQRP